MRGDVVEEQGKAIFRLRDSWKILLLVGVTLAVIYALVHYLAGTERFWQAVGQARWRWLVLPLLLVTINLFLATARWTMLVRALGFSLPFGRALYVVMATWPLALVIPSRGGDLLRAVAVRDLMPPVEGAGSVVVEKWIDVQSLCLLAVIGSIGAGLWWMTGVAVLFILLGWGAVLVILFALDRLVSLPFIERFEDKIRQFFSAFQKIIRQPGRFLTVSALSLLAWCGSLGILAGLLAMFQAEISGLHLVACWPFSIFIGLIPITMAGMGTRDAAFVSLLGMVHLSPINEAAVLAATLGYALVVTWLTALVGLPFMMHWLFFTKKKKGKIDEADRTEGNNNASSGGDGA